MDLQSLLGGAICQYKDAKYHVVINIVQQANLIRNDINSPVFLDLDILGFLSKFKLHKEPQHTVQRFLKMCCAKGYCIMDKIYAFEGSSFLEAFYNFVLDKCLEKFEDDVFGVSQTLFLLFGVENSRFNSKYQDVRHLKLIFFFWMMLIEKHRQMPTSIEDIRCLGNVRPEFNTTFDEIYGINKSYVKNAIKKWLPIAKKEFCSLQFHASFSAFDIVQYLSMNTATVNALGDFEYPEHFYYAFIHSFVLTNEMFNGGRSSSLEIMMDIPLEIEEGVRNEWYMIGQASLQSKDYPNARFMMNGALQLARHLGSPDLMNYYTDIALCHMMMGNLLEAIIAVKQATSGDILVEDKEQALKMKDLAKELFATKKYEEALEFYKGAFKMAPNNEKILKRDISSNIVLMFTKLEMYKEAASAAETCITLDRTWRKGYYRLGFSQYKLRQYHKNISTVQQGLQHCAGAEAIDLYILLFKSRAILETKQDEVGAVKEFQSVLNELLKESTKESWKALGNLILTTSNGRTLNARLISLHKSIYFNVSYELFEHLVLSGCNVNEVQDKVFILQKCLQRKHYKKSALLIVHGAKREETEDGPLLIPPLIRCVVLTMFGYCDINVLECMFSLKMVKNISEQDQHGNTALHVCCQNDCTAVKLEIVQLLLHNNINRSVRNFQRYLPVEMLSRNDPRALKIKQAHSSAKQFENVHNVSFASGKHVHSYDEKPLQHLDEKPSSSHSSKAKTKEKEYVPVLNDDAMRCFHVKDWKEAVSLFGKKIDKMRRKTGQEQQNCEILVFAAICHLEMSNEKSVQAFSYLKKATNIDPRKGVELVKDALIYHTRSKPLKEHYSKL